MLHGILIAVFVVNTILTPLVLIWGLGFLGFNIPFTMETWFGAFLVSFFVQGGLKFQAVWQK